MLARTLNWIEKNHLGGQAIPISHRQRQPYPEVTGHCIQTLLSVGENELAEQFALWLITVQNANGSFSLRRRENAYVFDTGQVIRGWLNILPRLPQLAAPIERACLWIIQTADPMTGRLLCPAPGGDWNLGDRGEINEAIHLYVLRPLFDAAHVLQLPAVTQAAEKALNYYRPIISSLSFLSPNALTHYYAYIQEALVELGLFDAAIIGMTQVANYQADNGSVPGYHDVPWICSTGLAQLAKVWFMLGENMRAVAALEFMAQIQNASGGFYGSYGVGATYFPTEEMSKTIKFVIDAEQLRRSKFQAQTAT